MTDEAGGKQIEEFIGFKAKLYSYKMFKNSIAHKRCQDVKKNVVSKHITLHYRFFKVS